MRNGSHYFPCGFVFSLSLVGHLAQQVILRPGEVSRFHDQFRAHPVHAGKFERRTKAALARWRLMQRHLRDLQGLQQCRQAFEFRHGNAGADTTCIAQLSVLCVVAEEQRCNEWSAGRIGQ